MTLLESGKESSAINCIFCCSVSTKYGCSVVDVCIFQLSYWLGKANFGLMNKSTNKSSEPFSIISILLARFFI